MLISSKAQPLSDGRHRSRLAGRCARSRIPKGAERSRGPVPDQRDHCSGRQARWQTPHVTASQRIRAKMISWRVLSSAQPQPPLQLGVGAFRTAWVQRNGADLTAGELGGHVQIKRGGVGGIPVRAWRWVPRPPLALGAMPTLAWACCSASFQRAAVGAPKRQAGCLRYAPGSTGNADQALRARPALPMAPDYTLNTYWAHPAPKGLIRGPRSAR